MSRVGHKIKQTLKWASIGCAGVIGVFLTLALTDAMIGTPQTTVKQASAPVREDKNPDKLLALVNDERKKAGVPELIKNDRVIQAAEQKCKDMVDNNYYDHINPKTGKHGYDYTISLIPNGKLFSENLNQGIGGTNKEFVDSWMRSEEHKSAMLDARYTHTGIAVCKIPSEPANSRTVVQEFVQLKDLTPKSSTQTKTVDSQKPSARPEDKYMAQIDEINKSQREQGRCEKIESRYYNEYRIAKDNLWAAKQEATKYIFSENGYTSEYRNYLSVQSNKNYNSQMDIIENKYKSPSDREGCSPMASTSSYRYPES